MELEDLARLHPEWKVPELRWRSHRVLELINIGNMEVEDSQETWMQ